MDMEAGFNFDLIGGVKRRAPLACAVAGSVMLLMYWVAMALPNEYTASATLLVEPQAVNESLVEAGAAAIDLNERLSLMTSEILSRSRLSRIIDELSLYAEESKTLTRQEIVDRMRGMISVQPLYSELTAEAMKSGTRKEIEINTFEIFFNHKNPKTAADVAQKVANDFIQEHIAARVRTTQTSLEFVNAEQERLSGLIEEVVSEIAEIKEKNPASLPENLSTIQRLHERAVMDLRYAQRELDEAKSNFSFWEHQVIAAAGQDVEDGATDKNSPLVRLQVLELQLSEMEARGFTARHPDMVRVKTEISAVRAALKQRAEEAQLAEDTGEGALPPSFAQQNAMAEQLRAQNRIGAAEAEIARLEVQLDQIAADMAAVPRVSEKLAELERRHREITVSLKGFSELQLNASVQADLERRQLGEKFRILEPAIPPLSVSSPNRPLILFLGLVLGCVLGVAAGVLSEIVDPSYHQERELQSAVGLPVLAVIPAIRFDPDMAAIRRRRRWRILVAGLVTSFCLTGGVVTYLFVNGAPGWITAIISGEEEEQDVEEGAGASVTWDWEPLG